MIAMQLDIGGHMLHAVIGHPVTLEFKEELQITAKYWPQSVGNGCKQCARVHNHRDFVIVLHSPVLGMGRLIKNPDETITCCGEVKEFIWTVDTVEEAREAVRRVNSGELQLTDNDLMPQLISC